MKTLTIYGASDDLVEAHGIPGGDEFTVYPDTPYVGQIHVRARDGKLNIHVIYDGSWAFAIAPQDGDNDTLPPWKIDRMFGTESAYSETVTIDVPDDAKMAFEAAGS
jgi:hypothetical protein